MLVMPSLQAKFGKFDLQLSETKRGYWVTLHGNGAEPQAEHFDLYPQAVQCYNILYDALQYVLHSETQKPFNHQDVMSGVRCAVCHRLTDIERSHRHEQHYIGAECWDARHGASLGAAE